MPYKPILQSPAMGPNYRAGAAGAGQTPLISITVFHDPSEFYHGEVIGEVLYAALLEAAETPDEQLKGAPTE